MGPGQAPGVLPRMVSPSITACRVEWTGFSTSLHHSTQILLWIKSGSYSLGHVVSVLPPLRARGQLRQQPNKKLPGKRAVNNTAKLLPAFQADCGEGVFSIASEGCLLTSELRPRPPFGLKASPKDMLFMTQCREKGKF